jgi:hypothetical protein
MAKVLAVAGLVALAAGWSLAAQQSSAASADRAAIERAALDYVEGIYTADPARIERSVHPQLSKRGFWRDSPTAPWGPQQTMTFAQLVALAKSWNADGKRDTSIKRVDVHEVLDQTASARITASWGIDYMHLAQYDGRWQIINIVWQAHPAK